MLEIINYNLKWPSSKGNMLYISYVWSESRVRIKIIDDNSNEQDGDYDFFIKI